LHDQRGCLSPVAVYVENHGEVGASAFATHLASALDAVAARLPLGAVTLEERAATRLGREEVEWTPDAQVFSGVGGTVIVRKRAAPPAAASGRTVTVHALGSLDELPALLPADAIECIGIAADETRIAGLVPALRARGIARLCMPGRMQRPPLAWRRGQRAPLGSLLGRPHVPVLEPEAGA
jgi:hypothetical protein